MRLWHGLDALPRDRGRSVVVVGSFDGVHRGHQRALEQAGAHAARLDLPVVAVVCDPVAAAPPHSQALTPIDRRAELLAEHGVDAVCVLPDAAHRPPEEFVRTVLAEGVRAAVVVVGAKFRVGGATADPDTLRALGARHGIAVEEASPPDDGTAPSSARVRSLLAEGDVAGARRALGRAHRVDGVVVHGAARGRELLGFPTANLECPPDLAVPADGVYAGWLLRLDGGAGESRWAAAVSVGTNPTFHGTDRTVEAYALDRDDLDLYGMRMGVEFTHHIRPMLRFDGIDALVEAMARDVARCRQLLLGGAAAV